MTRYVRMGTEIDFQGRKWIAQEPALSFYLDLHGPTVFVSQPTEDLQPIERLFAEAGADGSLMMRAVATITGETSDGGGEGDIGVPGAPVGMATAPASAVYDG